MTSKPVCPQCNSENIQKLTFYLSEKKESRKGTNVIAWILLIIFFPVAMIFLVSVAVMAWLWPVALALAVILAVVENKKKKALADKYICLVCGSRFPLQIAAPAPAAKTASEAPKRDLWRKK